MNLFSLLDNIEPLSFFIDIPYFINDSSFFKYFFYVPYDFLSTCNIYFSDFFSSLDALSLSERIVLLKILSD
jgi:hypothetical protein